MESWKNFKLVATTHTNDADHRKPPWDPPKNLAHSHGRSFTLAATIFSDFVSKQRAAADFDTVKGGAMLRHFRQDMNTAPSQNNLTILELACWGISSL